MDDAAAAPVTIGWWPAALLLLGGCGAGDADRAERLRAAGPNLHGIMDRAVAADPRFGYTQALIDHGGRWNDARMDAWLAAPARVVPGTRMAFAGVRNPMERADLIAYLRSESR